MLREKRKEAQEPDNEHVYQNRKPLLRFDRSIWSRPVSDCLAYNRALIQWELRSLSSYTNVLDSRLIFLASDSQSWKCLKQSTRERSKHCSFSLLLPVCSGVTHLFAFFLEFQLSSALCAFATCSSSFLSSRMHFDTERKSSHSFFYSTCYSADVAVVA